MRILVCGSRHFIGSEARYTVYRHLDELLKDYPDITIIEGRAFGVDTIAHQYALDNDFNISSFPADWRKYGKAAGPIRNKQMLDEGKPDLVIAFLAPDSRGTKDMISQATKAGVPVKVIDI